MIRDPRLHCWGYAQRLVNPAEVVVHEMKRHGVTVIIDLLAEAVSQTREPPHRHAHGQVLAL